MNEKLPEKDNHKIPSGLLRSLSLATAYPSSILFLAWFFKQMIDKNILSKLTAAIIFSFILFALLIQIVQSGFFKKN